MKASALAGVASIYRQRVRARVNSPRLSRATHQTLFFLYFSVTASLSLFIFFFSSFFLSRFKSKKKERKKNFRKKEKQSTPPALEPKTLALFQTFPPPVRLCLSHSVQRRQLRRQSLQRLTAHLPILSNDCPFPRPQPVSVVGI